MTTKGRKIDGQRTGPEPRLESDAGSTPQQPTAGSDRGRRQSDTFELYDLRVEVAADGSGKPMVCNHPVGAFFELRGEELHFPPGQTFPIYPLAAILPLLPAKQRLTDPNDWMTTDTEIACPDPHCGGIFRIRRIGKRTFRHGDVTVVPLHAQEEAP
ncbi:TIGR04076 family protein [Candidatus Bipolaricaulota bacterium]|nr:TIGR04076 family protein [Candidatus Bipolaricaulota bacterium]